MTEKDKKMEPVVTGGAQVKKKNALEKVNDFLFEDPQPETKDVPNWLMYDIVQPTAKKFIWDAADGLLGMVRNYISVKIFGNKSPIDDNKPRGPMIAYNSMYSQNKAPQTKIVSGARAYEFDNLTFDTEADARNVLRQLKERLSTYGLASVGNLYDSSGYNTDNYQVYKYGWTNLDSAEIVHDFNGRYFIRLPKALPIE